MGAARATTALFSAYLLAPLEFHTTRNSAKLARTATWSIASVHTAGLLGVASILSEVAVLALLGALVVLVSPVGALFAVAYFAVAGLVFNRRVQRDTHRLSNERETVETLSWKQAQQAVGALREIRLRGAERSQANDFQATRSRLQRIEEQLMFATSFGRYYAELVFFVGFGIVAAVQVLAVGDSAFASLALMLAVGLRLLPSVSRLLFGVSAYKVGEGCVTNVIGEIDAMGIERLSDVELVERPVDHGAVAPASIELEAVSYTYPGKTRPAVVDISFSVVAGQSVGIVGTSGSGKTTTVDLLCGLLTPSAGSVQIGGQRVSRDSARIAYVPQDVFMLDSTLRHNIAFATGEEDAALLDRAVASAQLVDWIGGLANGLDTPVGERGAMISGGQRQRIGITRALYQQPAVLVLDEATSALDVETESHVASAIHQLRGCVTLVVVAHRLSTVRNCDQIVVLDNGEVAATGTYDELAAHDPRFSRWVGLAATTGRATSSVAG